jgi:hypothetical protein
MSARVRLSTQERRLIGGQTDVGDQQARVGQDQTGEGELRVLVVLLYTHPSPHDLTKKRNCTLGLHGPWGESSVFIRITFTFPKDYAHGIYPRGTATELERNPLILKLGLSGLSSLTGLSSLSNVIIVCTRNLAQAVLA